MDGVGGGFVRLVGVGGGTEEGRRRVGGGMEEGWRRVWRGVGKDWRRRCP